MSRTAKSGNAESEALKGRSVLKAEAEGWSVLTSCLQGSVLKC
jgi:hypothetical protein